MIIECIRVLAFRAIAAWSIRISFIIGVLACFAVMAYGDDNLKKKTCRDHPDLSGPCYKVKGRMFLSNGTPSFRIWPIGTKRILGVSEARFMRSDYANMPDDLAQRLNCETAIYADFIVCPFTKNKPGVMRLVCVESAKNISIRKVK
jgi:hypothetical protein